MSQGQLTAARTESKHLVIFIASVAALAGILFGFDTGIISGAILFIDAEFKLSALMNGVVVSSVLLGAVIGAGFGGRLVDNLGRRHLLLFMSIVFIVGTLVSAFSPNIDILIISRVAVGIAIGLSSFVAPLYIAEIAPVRHRGALVSLNQLAITIGIVISYVMVYAFSASGSWRWMFGVGVIPAILLFIGMLYLPQSPRWMVLRGFSEKAREILQTVRKPGEVEQELADIQQSVRQEHIKWSMLFRGWMKPALIVALGLALFQQVTGINTIIYYAPTIFNLSGFQTATAGILATLGIGVVNVLFTVIALPLIDKWGRRPLLLIGLTGMIIALALLSFSFHEAKHEHILQWLTLGSMMIYIMSFAISLGPIMWLIISEIFPLRMRGTGSSFAIAFSWLCNMIVALTFLTLIDHLGADGTFLLYAIISVLGWIFVYFMVPETKGISLEQIEMNLRAGKSGNQLGNPLLD